MTKLPGTHWYIRNDSHTARDNKRIAVGVTHTLDNDLPLETCHNGYHASKKFTAALYYGYCHGSGRYRNAWYIYRVTLSRERDNDLDKSAARWRKYVAKAGPFSYEEMCILYYDEPCVKSRKLKHKIYSQLRKSGRKCK